MTSTFFRIEEKIHTKVIANMSRGKENGVLEVVLPGGIGGGGGGGGGIYEGDGGYDECIVECMS